MPGMQSLTNLFGKKFSNLSGNLLTHLSRRIQATGPITVSDYMRECLTHPTMGYYMGRDVFGQRGDFVTSPEISQIFGELVGIWIVNEWMHLGQPKPFQIVELGPGRGTLSADVLRVVNKFPDLKSAISLQLVEVSPALRFLQREVLCGNPLPRKLPDNLTRIESHKSREKIQVQWFNSLQDVPHQSSCFIAHEFLDALPIHKFQFKDDQWHEVLIDNDKSSPSLRHEGSYHLRYVLSGGATAASSAYLQILEEASLGGLKHFEISPEAGSVAQQLAGRVAHGDSCALIADYGHTGEKTDTFRGFKSHKLHDPLLDPGSADLTADVDFNFLSKIAVKEVADKVLVHGPVSQTNFLVNMGISIRLQMLLKTCSSQEDRKNLISGFEKLVGPDEMGERFRFMNFLPKRKDNMGYIPAGFCQLNSAES